MATRNSQNLRGFLRDNRDRERERERDDEPRERSRSRGRDDEDDDERDDEDDREPESERRPARGRDRDDDDRPSRTRSRDDDDDRPRRSRDDEDDRPRNSRRNHTPKAGRFSGVPSDEGRPPQLEDGKSLLRITKTYESENPKTGCWFQLQFEVLDSTNKKHRPGDKVSFRYHTERKSLTVTQGKIVAFTRAACGFKTDEEMRKRIPGMSESGKAPYSVLVDAALGVDEKVDYGGKRYNPTVEFGDNPLADRVIIADVAKGKYDEEKDRQYYESEWSPCDQKLTSLDLEDEPRGRQRGRASERDDEERPSRSRSRDSNGSNDRGNDRPARGSRDEEPARGRGRAETKSAPARAPADKS